MRDGVVIAEINRAVQGERQQRERLAVGMAQEMARVVDAVENLKRMALSTHVMTEALANVLMRNTSKRIGVEYIKPFTKKELDDEFVKIWKETEDAAKRRAEEAKKKAEDQAKQKEVSENGKESKEKEGNQNQEAKEIRNGVQVVMPESQKSEIPLQVVSPNGKNEESEQPEIPGPEGSRP